MACMIDLRRLQVLRAVAYYGTVTAAARALHLTPSAASQQVRRLAADLGVVLLEPHGRRVQLTTTARSLLEHADAVHARWQAAEADLHAIGDQPAGLLRLSGFPTAVSTLLAPLAVNLLRRYPRLEVQIREAEPVESFDLVFDAEIDLAVVEATPDSPPSGDTRFDQQPLLDDPFDLLVAAGHRFAQRADIALGDAADEDWIIGMPASSSRQHVLAACSAAGFRPRIAHQAREWTVVATLVTHQLGVALVPRLAQLPPHLAVTRLPVTGNPSPTRKLLTCTRCGSRNHPSIATALHELDHAST